MHNSGVDNKILNKNTYGMWAVGNKTENYSRIPLINCSMSADGTEYSSLNYVFL